MPAITLGDCRCYSFHLSFLVSCDFRCTDVVQSVFLTENAQILRLGTICNMLAIRTWSSNVTGPYALSDVVLVT